MWNCIAEKLKQYFLVKYTSIIFIYNVKKKKRNTVSFPHMWLWLQKVPWKLYFESSKATWFILCLIGLNCGSWDSVDGCVPFETVRLEWIIAVVGCVVISVCVYCVYHVVVCCQGGCGAGINTLLLQPFPVLHARPAGPSPRLTVSLDTAQQGAVDCLHGTRAKPQIWARTAISFYPCQCDKSPDSCFSMFSFFLFFSLWNS